MQVLYLAKEYMLNALADKTNIQNQFPQHLQSVNWNKDMLIHAPRCTPSENNGNSNPGLEVYSSCSKLFHGELTDVLITEIRGLDI